MFRCVNVYENGFPARFRALSTLNFSSMLLKTLREEVLEANLELVRRGLVLYTFGNVERHRSQQGHWSPSSPAAFPTKNSSRSTS